MLTLAWLAVLGLAAPALAASWPQEGDAWPALEMSKPRPAAEARYLGLKPGQGLFRLQDIQAELVLVEVFSMYCPICQSEAPRLNQVHELVRQRGLADRLKFLGLGVGNSETEVEVFRSKYEVPFALAADGDYRVHKALGEPRTPLFLLVRPGPEGGRVLYAKLGPIGQPEEFLQVLLEKSGLAKRTE